MDKRPLLICLTATRNYGWITKAFLEANTKWADYIIIVDQMSEDGTREMASQYDNVIILDNHDLSYSETKRCVMALDRARQIKGDKILVGLDIDEILPSNVINTSDWEKIINSAPGEMFCLSWANILPDKKNYYTPRLFNGDPFWMYRIFHDDGITQYNNEGHDMHTHHLPYNYKGKEYKVTDFSIIHFGEFNFNWNFVKQRYYQIVDYDKNHRTATQLDRMYNKKTDKDITTQKIEKEWLGYDFNIFDLIDIDSRPYFIRYMKEKISENGINRYSKLNIWDTTILNYLNIQDPRNHSIKLFHKYLNKSRNNRSFVVRGVDKILKLIGV